ncbi:FG-GAP-like repeat-containing protein [Spirosoma sp. 209]|uniref:FG-GAP-like repeat-containing protein n=1 Tax=Spirosoma sp. 209 TaxID=1955701 RepID=UPI00098CF254|nr:FG-GAP-like repeat-containing protein [Spirosoma sp. 209]
MKKLFTLCFLVSPWWSMAQSNGAFGFQYDQRPTVSVNGQTVLNPWVGGLNATQYSTLRLNDDTRDDLVVFDRTTNKLSTFVAIDNPTGSGIAWRYAPEYEAVFPTVYSWLLLVDYDGDGQKDLFTNGASSIRLFRNEPVNGRPVFRLVSAELMTEGYGGRQSLYVAGVDTPAILDYDNDGDIDVLTFDPSGDQISYQQNVSVERTGKRDGLDFKRTSGPCWGYFKKNFCNDFVFGLECGDAPASVEPITAGAVAIKPPLAGTNPNGRPLHSGNTLTVVDTDGDGNKDLLFGFVTCSNLARLRGAGPNSNVARFVGFDSLFPASKPIVFPAFPAVSWEDVDGDGQKDLLASPNVGYNENQVFDFRASGWYYKNRGNNRNPNFQFVQTDFLQKDMLDLGENATPALADLDGDGDADLLVGFDGLRTGTSYRAGLWQFENQGTNQNPAFVLVTTDYLGISQSLALTSVLPQLIDIDANGSVDLVLTGTGARNVEMRALVNTAPRGAAVRFDLSRATSWALPGTQQIGERPTLTDVDRDGLLDLLLGKNDGTISYYRNAGSATSPSFQLQNQTFGGLTANVFQDRARSLVVADLNGDQKAELISASDHGELRIYRFPDRPDQPLTLLDSLPGLGLPGAGLVAAVADLDGDQLPDLMLGSRAGGLRYLKNTSQKVVVTGTKPEEPVSPWAFPNPTDHFLTVRPAFTGQVELLSLAGQAVLPAQPVRAGEETLLDVSQLADGTYLLRLTGENRPAQVQKVVVWK